MDGASSALIDLDASLARPLDLPPISPAEAWRLLLTLRRRVDDAAVPRSDDHWSFRLAGEDWQPARGPAAEIWVEPLTGVMRRSRRAWTAEARALLDRHGHHATRSREHGQVVAVLGQSLDGFIATRAGHSRYINGQESLDHLHRIRALSDAVLIGVGTALADGPRVTTRNVVGPHAVRVVIDPRGRLPPTCGLLCDGAATTLVIRATDGAGFATRISDQGTALYLPSQDGVIAPSTIVHALAERGLSRLLVEGGGITVGRFLEAGLIDQLQLVVSPLIIGAGRPALPVAPAERLDQALRPACSRHLLGEDVLFALCFPRHTDRS